MAGKSELKTIRISTEEAAKIALYLKQNPVFESFSSLARAATLAFMQQHSQLPLKPLASPQGQKRPPFLWDYDLTQDQIHEILKKPGLSSDKQWLIERILREARFDEATRYLTVGEIQEALPHLRLPEPIRQRWEYAISRWTGKNHG